MAKTLVIIKPDAVKARQMGEIIARIERKGLKIVKMDRMIMGRFAAGALYVKFQHEPFFDDLVAFMEGGPSVRMIVDADGMGAIAAMRTLIGAGDGDEVKNAPGTIRGDLATSNRHNVIHASDSYENAQREIRIFFPGYLD